jgi:hypothetical protein
MYTLKTRNQAKQSGFIDTPFCKICKDAGKSKTDYSSHFPKTKPDMNGKVRIICPTLLAQECRYCHECGHTPKYCPILLEKNKIIKRPIKNKQSEKVLPISKGLYHNSISDYSSKNIFNLLGSDYENEEKEEEIVNVEYPTLNSDRLFRENSKLENRKQELEIKTSWAEIAMKPKKEKIGDEKEKKIPFSEFKKQMKPMARWADMCDDSSDDDEDY